MKKAINIIVVIVIVLVAIYFISNMSLNSQINKLMKSLKQSGYATTISEIKPVSTQENRKAAEIIATAYQEITKGNEDKQNVWNQNIRIADSINYTDNPQLFNQINSENKTVIDLLLEAAKYPQADFGYKYQDGYNAEIPKLIPALVKFCRILRIYAKQLIAQGKTEQGFDVLKQTVRLANISQDNTVFFHLIKAVALTSTFNLIQSSAEKASIASLESLITCIEKIDPRSSMMQGIQNEIIIGTNAFDNDKNFAHNVLNNLEPRTIPIRVYCSFLNFVPFKKYGELKFIRTSKKSLELTKKPYFESKEKWIKLDKSFHKRLDMFSPNLMILAQRTENLEARKNITLLGLNAIIYKKKFGHLPNSLNDLMSNIPIDPYSGKQYIYKKLADGFMIYGVGADGKNDNGNSETDIVWTVKI